MTTTSSKTNSPAAKDKADVTKPSADNKSETADGSSVIRFATNDKPLGRTISYVIKQLRDGTGPVVLQGSGRAMTKVATVAGIARDRVGDIHQICQLTEIPPAKEGGPEITGIQITLSAKELDAKAMKDIGYCEPQKKGFILADLPEATRKRFLNKRRQSATPRNAKKGKDDDVKKDQSAKPATNSPKEREASAKPAKKSRNQDKKSARDDKKVVESEAKEVAEAEGDKKKKSKSKRRNNKKDKAADDENQPPASNVKSDMKTPSAADKQKASGENSARGNRPQNEEKLFRGGQATRRGAPQFMYDNYGYGHGYEYYPSPYRGYYGEIRDIGGSPISEEDYQRARYGTNRGGNGRPMQYPPRYNMGYNQPPARRGGYEQQRGGAYGYPRPAGYMGDLSGKKGGYRSDASHRDQILMHSTVKKEVGLRTSLEMN